MSKKRVIQFIFLITVSFVQVLYSSEKTIAVLDFENNSIFNAHEYESLCKGFAEILITELNQVKNLRVVERQKLRLLLDELKLSQSGIITPESTVKIGHLLGAQHLVFGGFIVTGQKKIRIDVRIVEVETGLTVKASEVTGKTRRILSLVKQLSKQILKGLTIRLTKNEEDYYKKAKNIELDTVILFSKGLEYEDRGEIETAKKIYMKVLKVEPDFHRAKVRLQQIANVTK